VGFIQDASKIECNQPASLYSRAPPKIYLQVICVVHYLRIGDGATGPLFTEVGTVPGTGADQRRPDAPLSRPQRPIALPTYWPFRVRRGSAALNQPADIGLLGNRSLLRPGWKHPEREQVGRNVRHPEATEVRERGVALEYVAPGTAARISRLRAVRQV
jgi:hypothetical protein